MKRQKKPPVERLQENDLINFGVSRLRLVQSNEEETRYQTGFRHGVRWAAVAAEPVDLELLADWDPETPLPLERLHSYRHFIQDQTVYRQHLTGEQVAALGLPESAEFQMIATCHEFAFGFIEGAMAVWRQV